jgi:tetratricopeptide (TPR) repeat protein
MIQFYPVKRVINKVFFLPFVFLASCGQAVFYPEECQNYIKAGNYQKAIEISKTAIQAYPRNTEPYLCLSTAYLHKGELDDAINTMKKAERMAPSYEDLAVIYNRLGFMYHLKGDLNTALEYHQKHLSVSREVGDTKGQFIANVNIADIYQSKGEYTKAIEYYQRSAQFLLDPRDGVLVYKNIAQAYIKQGKYRDAVENYKIAYEYAEKTGDKKLLGAVLIDLGDARRLNKDLKSAYENLIKGLEIAKAQKDDQLKGYAYLKLGLFYKDKGDLSSAKEFLKRAYEIYISMNDKKRAQEVLEHMKRIEKR